MKTIVFLCATATLVTALNSCGECACNYNKDRLRDIPVHRTQSFH